MRKPGPHAGPQQPTTPHAIFQSGGIAMFRHTKAVVALAIAALLSVPAFAEGTLEKIKSQGFITIAHRDASIPFSYYDANQKPVGYAMDLCMKVVDAVKKKLNMPKLEVKYQL